jgi:trans-aconitate methyltransferase
VSYDPVPFWKTLGVSYERWFRPNPLYAEQEEHLGLLVEWIDYSSVLEIGCGFGRMTKIAYRPGLRYLAIDVSEDQLASSGRHVPGPEYRLADVRYFTTDEKFDLVLASEVLMHIPPADVGRVIESMKQMSNRYIVSIDLATWEGTLAKHNWCHDYLSLYAPYKPVVVDIGRQAMFIIDKEVS